MATGMPVDLRLCGSFTFEIVDGHLATRLSLSAIVKGGRVVFRKLMALIKSLKMAGLPTAVFVALVAIGSLIAAATGTAM